jgi:hypothetical protein
VCGLDIARSATSVSDTVGLDTISRVESERRHSGDFGKAEMRATVTMRHYFSTYLLWHAEHLAYAAQEIEDAHDPRENRFDIKHEGCVLGAILAAEGFLEAVVNELFQDAHDSHGVSGEGYIAPLTEQTRRIMAELWRGTAEGTKVRPLEKYELLLTAAGVEPMERGARPYQDAHLVVQLRNAIAHYQPESVSPDWPHRMADRLRGRFPDNKLMTSAGNPWWPSHCLGAGCARWAVSSAVAVTDHVCGKLSIRPNYMRLRDRDWSAFGTSPNHDRWADGVNSESTDCATEAT